MSITSTEFNNLLKKVQNTKTKCVKVRFTKSNGEDRTMYCTKNMDLVPKDCYPKGIKAPDSQAIAKPTVFDLVKKDWRRVTLDKVYEAGIVDWNGKEE